MKRLWDIFSEKIEELLPLEEILEQGVETAKSKQEKFLRSLPLPDSIIEALTENNSEEYYEALAVDSFEDYISNYIACTIISAISFVVTFLVIYIALKVLCFSLDLISKLPVLHQINKLFGMAAGFLHGLLLVWLGCIVLTAISGSEAGGKLMAMVVESELLSFIYNNNLLLSTATDLAKTLL